MWCVWDREMIHVTPDHEDLMLELENYARSIERVIDNYKFSNDGIVLTMRCSCDLLDSMWNIAERNHVVQVHPAIYLDGWGYFKVINFSEEDTKKFFADLSKLGEIELTRKRLVHSDAVPSTIWIESFFLKVDRQADGGLCKSL